jgi:hypothetical protein
MSARRAPLYSRRGNTSSSKPASWVIVEKATGKAVLETFNPKVVANLNTAKYKAVPIGEYLGSLNRALRRQNAKPGYAHLEPPSRGAGARLPSEIRRASAGGPRVGDRVTLNVKPAMPGVFTIMASSGGRVVARRSDGLTINAPATAVRSARNPWPVELHSVVYKERKPGDGRPHLYEHEFGEGGGPKPRLAWDGRKLKIQGGRATVRKGWIHG